MNTLHQAVSGEPIAARSRPERQLLRKQRPSFRWSDLWKAPLGEIELPRLLLEADVVVTLPVLKTHALTYFTGALKNQWGCLPQYDRGLRVYNMCGYGRFKKKFGGDLVTLKRWHKCYWRTARWARRGYELYFQKRIRLQGWWQRMTHSQEGA